MLLATTSIALLVIAISAIVRESSSVLLIFTLAWTIVSVSIGLWIGRDGAAMESIRVMLSRSRPEPVFPKIEPGAVLITRLWPVLVIALAAAIASIWFPSLAIATSGYGLIWSLSWRKQSTGRRGDRRTRRGALLDRAHADLQPAEIGARSCNVTRLRAACEYGSARCPDAEPVDASVWLILPTYNEAENIGPMIAAVTQRLGECTREHTVLIVDDNSPDGTGEAADLLAKTTRPCECCTARARKVSAAPTWPASPSRSRTAPTW